MTRIPLVLGEPTDPVAKASFDLYRQEGREPISLYRALANSPKMLRAYSGLARGLRHEAEMPRPLRELAILRTAQLTGSPYEWAHHRLMAMAAGVTEEQVREVGEWRSSSAFDERERAALQCAEDVHAMTVSDESFAELERLFGLSQTLELVLTAAFYQAVARVLQALDLDVEPEYRPEQ
jgi:alkylhydroperoxidase family enzyme